MGALLSYISNTFQEKNYSSRTFGEKWWWRQAQKLFSKACTRTSDIYVSQGTEMHTQENIIFQTGNQQNEKEGKCSLLPTCSKKVRILLS